VITLSINHRESTTEARIAKSKYNSEIHKSIDPYFWHFVTADSSTIRKITNAVGWDFRESGDDFVHTTSSVLITPNKMISQYFYGTYFNYMHFAMSVEKAKNEKVEPTRLKTLKYCYNYKPKENKSLRAIFRNFGISLIILVVAIFTYLALLKPKSISSDRNLGQ
jgi:protein SCO1